jgi:hypothetical protein
MKRFAASCVTVALTTALAASGAAGADGTDDEAQALSWSKAFDVPEPFYVRSVVAAHDRFYALGHDHEGSDFPSSKLWTSNDGTDWVELDTGELSSDEASLLSLVGSERGLLALGVRPVPEGHAATAWYSADGVTWDARDLGHVIEPATEPYGMNQLDFSGAALGPSGAVATAMAFPGFDWTGAQLEAIGVLPDDMAGIDPDRVQLFEGLLQVTVGPFVVFSEPLESLGLSEIAEAQRKVDARSYGAEQPMMFWTGDLQEWTTTEGNPMRARYVDTVVTVGDEYVASGYGPSGGGEVHVSSDGLTWESVGESLEGSSGLFVMGDRLLSDQWQGSQRVTLVSDDAGRTWQEVVGPDINASWLRAAGPAGVLATGTEGEVGWGATPEPGEIERDGFRVVLDSSRGELTVSDEAGTPLVSSTLEMDPMGGWGYFAPEELVYDFDAETAAVKDPVTGEVVVTLTFDDLDRLGASMIGGDGELLLFSPDAERWTVTELEEAFGPATMLAASAVGNDRAVAVVASGFPGPHEQQALWVGLPVAGEAAPTMAAVEGPPAAVMGGPAPTWERVLDLGERDLDTLVATDSGLWAVEEARYEPNALWHSTDGIEWTQRDAVAVLGDGAIVDAIAEGGPGLLAIGSMPAGDAREAMAWTSADGQTWTASPLGYTMPAPEQPFMVSELMIQAIAAGPGGAVIATWPHTSIDHGLLEPAVAAALPVALRDFATDMGVMIEPQRVRVSVGPFEVLSEPMSELDVDRDLMDAYASGVGGGMEEQLLIFATDDYVSWQQVDEWAGGDRAPSYMTAAGDGFLAASFTWGGEPGLYASADGLTWEPVEPPADRTPIRWLETDGGRVLLVGDQRGQLAVWESTDDGETWSFVTSVPDDAWDVRTGAFGMVAMGEEPSEWWDRSQWRPTVIEQDGYTMSIAEGPSGLTLTGQDGETLLSDDLYGAGDGPTGMALPSSVTADNDRGVFTVTDPESGEELMSVTYQEMEDAFERAQGPTGAGPQMFVAYSADGQAWSKQLIPEIAGAAGWIGSMAVGDDYVAMVVSEMDGPSSIWRTTAR